VNGEPGDVLLSQKLQKLLNRLPAKHRAIVVLRYQEDLDPSDIALQLDMPVATVKSTLHRALGMLRRALERTTINAQEAFLKREAV
jgi:RNA polymerase sigma-70 factor (ECF subfamily)